MFLEEKNPSISDLKAGALKMSYINKKKEGFCLFCFFFFVGKGHDAFM